LQKFSTTVEQLAYCAYSALPVDYIKREAGKLFAGVVKDLVIRIQLLLGGEGTVSEALRQVELQAIFLAARPLKTSSRTFWGS
jgi:hypothetical protein